MFHIWGGNAGGTKFMPTKGTGASYFILEDPKFDYLNKKTPKNKNVSYSKNSDTSGAIYQKIVKCNSSVNFGWISPQVQKSSNFFFILNNL